MSSLLLAMLLALPTLDTGEVDPAFAHDPAELVPVAVPEPSALAMAYYRSGILVWFLAHVWGLLVPAAILFTGLSGRLRDLARRAVGFRADEEGRGFRRGLRWVGMIAVYAILYLGLTLLIDLPIDYVLGHLRAHEYGLSNQSFGRWFGNELKSVGVSMVGTAALLWIPYLLLARSPRRWWLWTGLLMVPFALGAAFIKPIWIDPLFNKFEPMTNAGLESKILDLARRAGIEGSRVFVVDKSRDTRTVNAYVTGLLGTERIVLWDTLLDRLDEKETLAVVGHEIGHYVLNHVAWGVSLSALGSLVLLFLVDRTGRWMIGRWGRRFRFERLSDVASVPLFILLLQLFNLAGAPIQLAASRAMEHEADRYGLELTRTNRSSALSFVKLQNDNLSNPRPGPLSILWRSSHPPIGDRIDFCNAYHPWTEGRPGRYVAGAR
jgi:STE24 endopeptidase